MKNVKSENPHYSVFFYSPVTPLLSSDTHKSHSSLTVTEPGFTPTQAYPANRIKCRILVLKTLLSYLSSFQLKSSPRHWIFTMIFLNFFPRSSGKLIRYYDSRL